MKRLLLVLAFLLFVPFANAQTILKPGFTAFSIDSIALTGAGIELQSIFNPIGTSYLNVYWNAYYIGGSNESIGATCYLNCISESQDCSSAKQCNYTGSQGPAVCAILDPNYDFIKPNNVTCKFFNPKYPTIEYKPYPNRTFYPIKFEVSYPSITTTVGQEAKLQINVRNIGLFTDNYTVNVTNYPSNLVAIDSKTLDSTVGPLTGYSYGSNPQTDSTYINLVVLASIEAEENICIIVNSTSKPSVNSFSGCIPVRSSYASLSDFSFLGIIWIIILSSVLILFNKSF
jgi:hypothetical protein